MERRLGVSVNPLLHRVIRRMATQNPWTNHLKLLVHFLLLKLLVIIPADSTSCI